MLKQVLITEIRRKTILVEVHPDEAASCADHLAESAAEDKYYPGFLDEDCIKDIKMEVQDA